MSCLYGAWSPVRFPGEWNFFCSFCSSLRKRSQLVQLGIIEQFLFLWFPTRDDTKKKRHICNCKSVIERIPLFSWPTCTYTIHNFMSIMHSENNCMSTWYIDGIVHVRVPICCVLCMSVLQNARVSRVIDFVHCHILQQQWCTGLVLCIVVA